jgi:hypothetical protein
MDSNIILLDEINSILKNNRFATSLKINIMSQNKVIFKKNIITPQ